MSKHMSTEERLFALINDIEMISKELIENAIAPKPQKFSRAGHELHVDLLISKDAEFKKILQLASEKTKIEPEMNTVKEQVDLEDLEIHKLQKQLQEAEHKLEAIIFQGRQKLANITKANKRPASSEEIMKCAHKISTSNGICAPSTWQQGDLRRPYPTENEMLLGFLGKSDLSLTGHNIQHQISANQHQNTGDVHTSAQKQFARHPSGPLHMSMGASTSSAALNTRNMSQRMSTEERLFALINDIEMISKELIENAIAPKPQNFSRAEHELHVDLLISKDAEFKKILQLASEKAKIEPEMNTVKEQVDLEDLEIHKLQKQLQEAEHKLEAIIFQGRQKFANITKANKRPASSEEIMKCAHKISTSNGICATSTWQQGDLRRPYPTEIEMRLGFLGKSNLSLTGHNMQHQISANQHRNTGDVANSAQKQFAWHPSGPLHMSMGASTSSAALNTRAHKDDRQDDVEVMSTDSSSYSSSDSERFFCSISLFQ